MRSIQLSVGFAEPDLDLAFSRISDFEPFQQLAEDIRSVQTNPGNPDRDSDWCVNFRRGLMRWNEIEILDPVARTIRFEQTDGDFERFEGSWLVAAEGAGSRVDFAVTYDFGIESLVGIMDPIAERVIKRAVCSVLGSLFGEITILLGGEALTDLAEPAAAKIGA